MTHGWDWTDDHRQAAQHALNAGYTYIKTAAGWQLIGEWLERLTPPSK